MTISFGVRIINLLFWVTNSKSGSHLVNGTYVSGIWNKYDHICTLYFKSLHNASSSGPYMNLVVGDVLWFNQWTAPSTINGNTNVNTNGTVSTIC